MTPEPTGDAIENKLVAARTRLILEKPFLGALVLRLPLQRAMPGWCAATYTDARVFYYNADYVAQLSFPEAQFVLAREALHCALSHFNRRGHRDKHRWQLACAHAVNLILLDEGLSPPADAPILQEFRGMTAEEIYPLLEQNDSPEEPEPRRDPESGDDGRGAESGQQDRARNESETTEPAGDDERESRQPEAAPSPATVPAPAPEPLSQPQKDRLQQQWQQRLAGAAQQAQQAGKLGEGLARMIELFLQPKLPWRAVLARYMNNVARDDYSYARPSSRRGDPAIYPSLRSAELDLVVAVDVSGSIDADEFSEFMTEVDALKAQVRARVTLLTCDSKITGDSPWIFEAWETCDLPTEFVGSGSTDFTPVFDWIERQDRHPDLLVYFTDARGRFPEIEPPYPAIWLVKGHEEVPWGQRIQLN